ncbi:MAG: DUF3343 domain-containing protein [Anaerolineaceae bacterium]|nr:DUF3343 domain-containing protein [Anaerolineaceae bacterium]
MQKEMILLVHTSGHAFSIEKALKKRGISCRLTPIPRKVSSDCGICVRFAPEALETVNTFTQTLPFEIQGIISDDEAN